MPRTSLTVEQVLTLLAETPRRISTLTTNLAPTQLLTTPNHDEWSANDVLAHLRACADVWGNSIATIIAEDRPTIRTVNPRTWIKKTDYLEQKFLPSLQAFTAQRTNLLALIQPLALEDWSRSAIVMGAGSPLERTVQNYAEKLVRHEQTHLKQIEHIVNKIHM